MDHGGESGAASTPARLLRLLDRVVRGRIAVVSGPAGHGKRQLVRDWFATHPELATADVSSAEDVERLRASLAAGEGLLVAVVSGRELLADPATMATLMALAERNPRLRLVFVGRVRPAAPLGSLAARGLLVDIDSEQLAWTREEVAAALAPLNPKLPAASLDSIMCTTRGWPAIARMFATEPLSFAHSARVTRLAGSYIGEEVLAGLEDSDIGLLQELAALPTLDPAAAAWMTGRGDAAAQLTRLQSHGVPISWDDGTTIRLNPLLRDFLRHELADHDPERHARLHHRAALWLRNRGRGLEAVALAMEAGQTQLAWMLAAEFVTVSMHQPELVRQMPRLVQLMPPGWEIDTIKSLVRGLATPQTMVAQLGAIDAAAMTRDDTGRFGYLSFVLGMVRTVGYPTDIDLRDALAMAEQLDSRGVNELDVALLSSATTEYGLWQLHHGDLSGAQDNLLNALGMARVINVPWAIVTCLGALAWIHAQHGQVATAQRLAEEAILTSADTVFTHDGLDEFALLALATTCIDIGDLPAGRRWLEQFGQHEEHLGEGDAMHTHLQAMLAVAQDDPSTAQRLVQAYRDERRGGTPAYHELLIAQAAFDAAVAQGDLEQAQAELDRIEELPVDDALVGRVVLRARLALARGDARTAHQLLEPVATAPGGSVAAHAKNTLHTLMVLGVAADELHHCDQALQTFQRASVLADRIGLNTPNARHTRLVVAARHDVPLTEAERNVLAHLNGHQTLTDTADELFVSVNTLKTHLRRIYRKLGVANREEAIERARVMGIRAPH